MTFSLRVSRAGELLIDAPISELYAKSIALVSLLIPDHIAEFPTHLPLLQGRLNLTVEAALQDTPGSHLVWLDLCSSNDSRPLELELTGLGGTPGQDGPQCTAGAAGGGGAWPAGGGGGGGSGRHESGSGGPGASGALAIFQWSNDGRLVDVEVFVTPGTFTWTKPIGPDFFRVVLFGGGGGGGSGAVTSSEETELALIANASSCPTLC